MSFGNQVHRGKKLEIYNLLRNNQSTLGTNIEIMGITRLI